MRIISARPIKELYQGQKIQYVAEPEIDIPLDDAVGRKDFECVKQVWRREAGWSKAVSSSKNVLCLGR